MIYSTIGQRIRLLREAKGKSQQELALDLGYKSDTAIHLIENGKRGVSIETLRKLSQYFGVSTSELIGEKKSNSSGKLDVVSALRADEQLDNEDVKKITQFIDFIKNQD